MHIVTRATVAIGLALALMGNSCESVPSTQQQQAQAARKAADSLSFTDNAEIANIQRRLQITSKPGMLGFILLMNEAGQPILYEGVVGKITSGGKRLTPPTQQWSVSPNNQLGPAPSDEGTWGSSSDYVFYWTTNGEYRQWNGKYLYSDKPFRLRTEPLIVAIAPKPEAAK